MEIVWTPVYVNICK